MEFPLILGLDSSTQSLTAVVVDRRSPSTPITHSISFSADPRLQKITFNRQTMLLDAREPGEADQPPELFLDALELVFSDLKTQGVDWSKVGLVNISAQQHGHVYLSAGYELVMKALKKGQSTDKSLASILSSGWSYPRAPIWKTSNTSKAAATLRAAAGGSLEMIRLTGSDSPLRFTGAVVRKVLTEQPQVWDETVKIHLLSSLIPSILTANPDVEIDWGNASGTSWMDYQKRAWDSRLIRATAEGLPGGGQALASKIPALAHPLTLAGTMCAWFVTKYGFSPEARVLIGSGDNPQTKVLYEGDLLSLGTSFVMMAGSGGTLVDERGWGNAMYDGAGRPFLFGCRTNGALVWDQARRRAGWPERDFKIPEQALRDHLPGTVLALAQPDVESFPPSSAFDLAIRENQDSGATYAGLIDSGLGLLFAASRPWLNPDGGAMGITGGAVASPSIVSRIAALWNRPIITLGTTGAALGAAAAALEFDGEKTALLPSSAPVEPRPQDVERYHRPGGYLEQLTSFWKETIEKKGARA